MNDNTPKPESPDPGPSVLERFIGQQRAVAKVRVALEASWNDGIPFPHTLLVGPPGLGKTALAKLVAKEMGSDLHEALSQTLEKPADLNALLLEAEDRDCVFLDEGDQLFVCFQTLLYRALEERKLFLSGDVYGNKPRAMSLSNLTVLMATNNEFSLVEPLRDRFKMILRFEYYSPDELAVVVKQRAQALQWDCAEEVFGSIAAIGRGIPRAAIRLLEACQRTSRSEGCFEITTAHFKRTCQLEGLDAEFGLDPVERSYLRAIQDGNGRPVRVGTLSARLGLPPRTISDVVESYLLRLGMVARSEYGRQLTPVAMEYLQRDKIA